MCFVIETYKKLSDKLVITLTVITLSRFPWIILFTIHFNTGCPRYIREIGTEKMCSDITNLDIKRPRMPVN